MKDDLLSKMTNALSDEYDGATAVPEATRARVVRTLAERRPRRRKWAAIGVPALVIFGGSTAWAAATGNLPKIVERAVSVFVGEAHYAEEVAAVATPKKGTGSRAKGPAEAALVDAPEEQPASMANSGEEMVGALSSSSLPLTSREAESVGASSSTSQKAMSSASPTKPSSGAATPPEDHTSLLTYQAAHRAHFQEGDFTSAVAGYRRYLHEEPSGTFALEAKYNLGVCLIRMGQGALAKTLLQPFAQGTYGNYRKDSAAKLLEALGE